MKRYLRGGLAALASLLFLTSIDAQSSASLAKLGWYADPEIHFFDGQFWIYPTLSERSSADAASEHFSPVQEALRHRQGVPPAYLQQTFFDALSSPDLVHWSKHEHVLDIRNVPWAAYAVWAPSVIHLQDRYYILFGANDVQKGQAEVGGIGLAVSQSPGGPFVDTLGKPIIGSYQHGAQPIDPFVFQDDDGKIYLYYGGQRHCNVALLSPDLKQVIPSPTGEMFREITPNQYVEGPFLIKRKGVYYLMWSEGDWVNSTYGVAYARSDSPLGPFRRVGKILQSDPGIANGPGHHSILQIPGTDDWYIAYHRHPLGDTDGNHRKLAIDRLYFDANGDILPIQMTANGVAPIPTHAQPGR